MILGSRFLCFSGSLFASRILQSNSGAIQASQLTNFHFFLNVTSIIYFGQAASNHWNIKAVQTCSVVTTTSHGDLHGTHLLHSLLVFPAKAQSDNPDYKWFPKPKCTVLYSF
jgi:hypothetical protein